MVACLQISELRVDVGGVPALDGLTLTSTGEQVLVLGAARVLFEVAAGLRSPTRGRVSVGGMTPREAMRSGAAACAPLDPPLPGSWSVLDYATWSARLVGHPRDTSVALAADALERMQLTPVARSKVSALSPAAKRALVVAGALATGAKTVLVEDPALGLPDDAAHTVARAVVRALADRRSLMFAGRVPLASPLALAADEAIVIDGSHLTAQGAPAEIAAGERTLALRVIGDVGEFVRRLDARGVRASVSPGSTASARVNVELGPLQARDLLAIATETNAVVVDLRPLARAFA